VFFRYASKTCLNKSSLTLRLLAYLGCQLAWSQTAGRSRTLPLRSAALASRCLLLAKLNVRVELLLKLVASVNVKAKTPDTNRIISINGYSRHFKHEFNCHEEKVNPVPLNLPLKDHAKAAHGRKPLDPDQNCASSRSVPCYFCVGVVGCRNLKKIKRSCPADGKPLLITCLAI
jgi:hypothetical protein